MVFTFKTVPDYCIEGNDILLATTKFGDIRFVDNMLIVPVSETKVYYYDYTKLEWIMKWANVIYDSVSAPQLYVDEIDLLVINDKFFNILDTLNDEVIAVYYRVIRHKHCFPTVNRGKLWYDRLKSWQIKELNDWYEAWLDITETHVLPVAPIWLKNKLDKLDEEEIL